MKTTNEETIYEPQNGMANEETVVENKNEVVKNQETKQKSNKKWADAAIGAGTGVAAGIIGTLFTSGTIAPAEDTGDNGNEVSDDGLTTPVVTDGELAIAHNVNDDMSFGEAFRVAHDEVGPGGVFEWHSQLYGTYTAAEWNSLSSEERMEYNSHLRVVGTPDYASNVSHHEQVQDQSQEIVQEQGQEMVQEQGQEQVQVQENETEDVAVNETTNNEVGQEEVEVASVNTETTSELVSENPLDPSTPTSEVDMEVEVLGVEYVHTDDGQDVAVGGMMVNGQEVYVLDADNDGTGDVAFMDVNGDGQVDENEIMDLSETPIDMSEFQTNDPSLCNITPEEPDYLADGTI